MGISQGATAAEAAAEEEEGQQHRRHKASNDHQWSPSQVQKFWFWFWFLTSQAAPSSVEAHPDCCHVTSKKILEL